MVQHSPPPVRIRGGYAASFPSSRGKLENAGSSRAQDPQSKSVTATAEPSGRGRSCRPPLNTPPLKRVQSFRQEPRAANPHRIQKLGESGRRGGKQIGKKEDRTAQTLAQVRVGLASCIRAPFLRLQVPAASPRGITCLQLRRSRQRKPGVRQTCSPTLQARARPESRSGLPQQVCAAMAALGRGRASRSEPSSPG